MSLAYRERIRLAERLPEPIYPFPAGPPDFVPAPATSPGPPVSSPGPADWGGISSPTPAAAPDAPIPAMPASAAPFVAAGAPTAVGQPTSVPAWPVDSEPPMTDQEPPAASAEPRADSAQPSAAVGFELLVQSGDSAPPPLVGGPSACPAPTQGGPQGLLDSEAAPPDGLEQRTILAAAPAAPNTADLARQNPWLTVLWAAALVACTVGFALRALTETALPLAAADLLTMLGAASAVGAIVLAGVNWAIRRPPPPSGNAHEGRPL
jgi:hypothetical protein